MSMWSFLREKEKVEGERVCVHPLFCLLGRGGGGVVWISR